MTSTAGSSPRLGSARPDAIRRLLADRGAVAAAAALALIALACALAPFYAAEISGTDPFRSNPLGTDARGAPVLADNTAGLGLGTTPLGPTWRGDYLLGADAQGRDLAARVLHGGRNSLLIAAGATALCLALAAAAGIAAGFAGGTTDAAASWLLDLTAQALAKDQMLTQFSGKVADSGEGQWTIDAAMEEKVPANVLTAALFARYRSRVDHTFGDQVLSAMRYGFGGHVEMPQ